MKENEFCDRYCRVVEEDRYAKNQYNLGCEGAYCEEAKEELKYYAKEQITILVWLENHDKI